MKPLTKCNNVSALHCTALHCLLPTTHGAVTAIPVHTSNRELNKPSADRPTLAGGYKQARACVHVCVAQ